jgi:uncharacterized protein (DUF983 family)
MAKFRYGWRCPKCGTSVKFYTRAAETKRRCSRCGTPVAPEEIDSQRSEIRRRRIVFLGLCSIVGGVMFVLFAIGYFAGQGNPALPK